VSDNLDWDTRDAFSCARKIEGTPEHTLGPLDGASLPTYLRFDVGARRSMLLRRPRSSLVGFASVNNVLRRDNELGYAVSSGGATRRGLFMLPLSANVGLDWSY
jgi:hypothetical protein